MTGIFNGCLGAAVSDKGNISGAAEFTFESTFIHKATVVGDVTVDVSIDTDSNFLWILFTDDGSGRTITWGANVSHSTATSVMIAGKKYVGHFLRVDSTWYLHDFRKVSV